MFLDMWWLDRERLLREGDITTLVNVDGKMVSGLTSLAVCLESGTWRASLRLCLG